MRQGTLCVPIGSASSGREPGAAKNNRRFSVSPSRNPSSHVGVFSSCWE